jgi:hypothetical protein
MIDILALLRESLAKNELGVKAPRGDEKSGTGRSGRKTRSKTKSARARRAA